MDRRDENVCNSWLGYPALNSILGPCFRPTTMYFKLSARELAILDEQRQKILETLLQDQVSALNTQISRTILNKH